jgi:hypothetical protein
MLRLEIEAGLPRYCGGTAVQCFAVLPVTGVKVISIAVSLTQSVISSHRQFATVLCSQFAIQQFNMHCSWQLTLVGAADEALNHQHMLSVCVTTLQVLAREVAVAKHEKELFELKKLHEALQAKAQHLEQQQQQLKAQAEVEQQHLTTQTQHQQHLAHLAQQEQQLHARSMGLDVREKQIAASATLLAARQHDFNKQLIAQAEAEQQHLTMQNQRQQHVAQQEQQLHGRTVGLDVRERQVSAAATLLAARQHDFNKSYQPLNADLHSRLQQVAAREQQLSALQAQLGAQSQSLAMREQQLRQAQGVQQQAAQVPYTYPYGHPGSYR